LPHDQTGKSEEATMSEVPGYIGSIGGLVAIVTAVVSALYLRRQTIIMAAQVDKQIEIKITRDLEAPEGVIDNKLRAFLNRRLSDVRVQLRTEFSSFSSRLEQVEHTLEHSHIEDAVKLWSDQKEAVDVAKDSGSKVYDLEREIREMQQVVVNLQRGIGNQVMIRTQIRGIAEHLLMMTNQE
jgi:hypothetical protein